ncbi:MAG: SDR family oxidoreductase [Myxococcota bacterium]|nr:SDR family oxidoreductase [Myxococcota bacterium]
MGYKSVFRSGIFDGDVAVVTGGGSGIGRCIAHELAALGATVIISGRKIEKLEHVRDEISASGGKADIATCNIREEADVRSLCTSTVEKYGALNFLVNNAGGQFMAPPQSISLKGWKAVIETNLTGTFLMCREARRAHMERHGGAIVNIVADFWNGMPMMSHTGAARAGVANLTKSLALSWAPNGIRVNSVAPGIIKSSGLKNYPKPVIDMLDKFSGDIPAKRLGTESEVSAAVAFLLSPAAAYITGTTMKVDGGSSIYRQIAPVPDHPGAPEFEAFHLSADLPENV